MGRWQIGALWVLLPATLGAQQATYSVRQGGTEIGRERVNWRTGTERSADGSSMGVESTYAGAAASVVLQRAADGTTVLFRLRSTGAGAATVLAATNGSRLALRREAGGAENARELPARPGTLIVDELAWSLLQGVADAATPRGVALVLVFPRTDRTLRVTATRTGSTVALAGDLPGTLTLDQDNRLQRADLPGPGITVVRAQD